MNETLPFTDIESLTNHYKCGKCNSLFSLINKQANSCPTCKGDKLSILDADDWYKELKSTQSETDWKKTSKNRYNNRNSVVDVISFREFDA
jgi:hypothetical protein